MSEIIHFNSQKDRLSFLKGGYEEIIPKKAEEPVAVEETKKTSRKKGKKKDDKVQAE